MWDGYKTSQRFFSGQTAVSFQGNYLNCWNLSVVKVKLKNLSVPAKITTSGHQTEINIYFYKADWKELDRLIEAA